MENMEQTILLPLRVRNACSFSEKRTRFSFRSDICHFVRSGDYYDSGLLYVATGQSVDYWTQRAVVDKPAVSYSLSINTDNTQGLLASSQSGRWAGFPLRCLVR